MRTLIPGGRGPLAGLLLLAFAAGNGHAASEATLSGRVLEARGGRGIAGATILLRRAEPRTLLSWDDPFQANGSPDGVLVLRTGSDGDYSTHVPRGRYEVAAFKAGYDFSLTAVNTQARGILDLSLRKRRGIILGDLPVGSAGQNLGLDWILRRSPNGVLRELDAAAGTAVAGSAVVPRAGRAALPPWIDAAPGGDPALRGGGLSAEAIGRTLDGRFVHRFSGFDPLGRGTPGAGETAGRATDLVLAGALGESGSWRFSGRAGESSSRFDRDLSVRRDRRTGGFAAGVDYSAGSLDVLTAEIEYGEGRYSVAAPEIEGRLTDQAHRVLGLRSRWNRSLGENARLYVDGLFRETGVDLSGTAETSLDGAAADRAIDRAVARVWQAGAGVALERGAHALDFGFLARGHRSDFRDRGVLLFGSPESASMLETDRRGNAVSLHAADDWRIAEDLVITYGLGIHGSLTNGAGFFVPRVGFTHDLPGDGGTVLRSVLTVLLDRPRAEAAERVPEGEEYGRDPGRIGYLIAIERRPEDSLQLTATLRYEPFRLPGEAGAAAPSSGSWHAFGEGGFFLTDGTAALHELDLEMARAFGPVHDILSGSVGRVRGRLTPTVERAPFQVLSSGELRYYDTRLSASYQPSETEVQIGYRWVSADTPPDRAVGPGAGDYRLLDLIVYQDIPWLSRTGGARFKVLMAYQGIDYGSLYDGSPDGAAGSASRVTGGVDIRF